MRAIVRHIILLGGLMLSASSALAGPAALPDSVRGIPRDRFMDFWDSYSVGSLHYGKFDVPNRIVGFFGQVDSAASLANAAMGFLETNHDVFRISDVQSELVPDTIKVNEDGGRTVVLQQVSRGLPVLGCHLDFVITPEWSMEEIFGRYVPGVNVGVDPAIDSAAAIGIARDSLTRAEIVASAFTGRLCILAEKKASLLVWEIQSAGQSGEPTRADPMYIDARTGAIVARDDS